MKKLFLICVTCFALQDATCIAADNSEKAKAMCYDIENYINALVEFTITKCLPIGGAENVPVSVILVSEKHVLENDLQKKGWLLTSVGAVGLIFNRNNMEGDQIGFMEFKPENKNGLLFPITKAKKLQADIKSDKITLEEMWAGITGGLKQHTYGERQ
jgi:hypothetical protein